MAAALRPLEEPERVNFVGGNRGWVSVALGGLALATLTYLYWNAEHSVDGTFEAGVYRLRALEHQLDDDVLRARYDVKDADDETLRNTFKLLSDTFNALRAEAITGGLVGDETARNTRDYARLLGEKKDRLSNLIERMEEFRGSVRALPGVIAACHEDAPAVFEDPVVAAQLATLTAELVVCNLSPQRPASDALKESIEGLAGRAEAFSETDAESLAGVVVVARDIDDARTRVDVALTDFMRVPLSLTSETLYTAHNTRIGEQSHVTSALRTYFIVTAVILLMTLIHLMYLLKKAAREFSAVNATLEQKVAERTRLLSKSNAELGTEIAVRKLAEIEAEEARNAAEGANQTKSDFLANMSHEIRTPMTAIVGFAEGLNDPNLSNDERLAAINTIRRNGEYLVQLINDILDLSKIEAGKLTVEKICFSPIQIMADVRAMMRVRAETKSLDLDVLFDGPIPETIESDPIRLRQVLINLIGNGIKFTEEGGVRVVVKLVGRDEMDAMGRLYRSTLQGPLLQFSVRDTGIGIPSTKIDSLFEPFTQADTSTTRRFGGTGLGLSISKHLVHMMGGDIHVESKVGRGTTFSFCIRTGPLESVEMVRDSERRMRLQDSTHSVKTDTSVRLEDCRVLLVEDGVDNQRLIQFVLTKAGADVDIGSNGQEGYDIATKAWKSGNPYDVILMDMQMPILDGYGATRKLRADGYTLPIIALTAHAMATDRDKCLKAGCNEFCTKPINRVLLVNTIAELTGKGTSIAVTPVSPKRALPQPKPSIPMEHKPTPPPAPEPRPTIPIVSEFADDEEMLALIQMFVDELGEDIERMRTALVENDLDALATVAHQLKGSSGGYGFPTLTEKAAQVEQFARGSVDPTLLKREVEEFADMCSRARAQ